MQIKYLDFGTERNCFNTKELQLESLRLIKHDDSKLLLCTKVCSYVVTSDVSERARRLKYFTKTEASYLKCIKIGYKK